MPVAMDRAFGATFKAPDRVTLTFDLSAGVGVSSVGRCHPKVVQAIQAQSQAADARPGDQQHPPYRQLGGEDVQDRPRRLAATALRSSPKADK